jgi:hypothetical protein
MTDQGPNPGPGRRSSLSDDEKASFAVDAQISHTGSPARDNPTKICKPFWKYMISHGDMNAWDAAKKLGLGMQDRPIFCFQRFGRTETILPDGRIVYIAGEHEDFYDPDFFIYNDVVVVRGRADTRARLEPERMSAPSSDDPEDFEAGDAGWRKYVFEERTKEILRNALAAEGASPDDIDIYRYPTDVFAPTDFHTATYHQDDKSGGQYIYIIGGLGYLNGPHRTATVTYRLDLADFSIRRMETTGDEPPVGKDTTAKKEGDDTILFVVDGREYALSLADMRWSASPTQDAATGEVGG